MNAKKLIPTAALIAALMFANSCKKGAGLWQPNPPYPGLEVKITSFTIDAGKDTVLVLSNGTSIAVPAGAMVNPEGQTVTGTYELLYREFHDAVDILLSGIPMEIRSAGQKQVFQTAGMFEVNAQQHDRKIQLGEGKSIDIRFASRYSGSSYNFFYMNPEKSAWEWVDLPETEINQQKVDAVQALSLRSPMIFLGDKFFVISFDRFLDIYFNNDYEKVYNARKNRAVRNKLEQYKFKVYNANIDGEVKFLRGFYHPAEMLWRDIDGRSFPSWTTDFSFDWAKDSKGNWYYTNYSFKSLGENQYLVSYKNGKSTFTKRMEAVMPLANVLKLSAEKWQQQYDEAIESLKAEQAKVNLMAETYRSFSINRMGLYNFDCLLKGLDEWTRVNATFTLSDNPIAEGDLIVVLGDNSGFVRVKPKEYSSMRINPTSNHRILMLLPEQQVGVFPAASQNAINIDSLKAIQNPAFTFKLESKRITDATALREMLGFNR